MDDVVLLNENLGELQIFIDCLKDSVGIFGMHCAPAKCKVPSKNRIHPKQSLVLGGKELNHVDKFDICAVTSHQMVLYRMKCLHAYHTGTLVAPVRHPIIHQESSLRCDSRVCPVITAENYVYGG